MTINLTETIQKRSISCADVEGAFGACRTERGLLQGSITRNEPSSNFHWDGVYLDLVFRSFPQISQAPIKKQRLTIQLNGTRVGTVGDLTLHYFRKIFTFRWQNLQV
jgi:hypothetical protein